MEIRIINKEKMKDALELVWQVFLEFEAPDYTDEGIKEFKKTIDDNKGIGKKLYEKVKSINDKGVFTVNSSPYAHEIYKHMGFIDTDTEQCINGLKFYPMQANF